MPMALLQQFFLSLGFFMRIPVPVRGGATLADSAWAFPLAGATVGAFAASAYLLLLSLGLAHGIAAWLALAFQIVLTGALHEDGLADTADALVHGRSREQKLAIMRDSR